MANPYFRFKKFTVYHDKCAMKVGTDAVLLGAWADTSFCKNILDIGTGTGIIALMLAQRSQATVEAIDIDKEACVQATENAAASPYTERIKVVHASCADFSASNQQKRYDLIVSNPPYFINSLKCPDNKRTVARHTDTLLLSDLIREAQTLLSPSGRIALVLPYERQEEVKALASANHLYICRQTDVIPIPGAAPKRLLVELSATKENIKNRDTLTIEEARHQYTPEYIALTKEFYLKM
ncbi:tRNA1(Val) (adenine(37)-N6)-methyltransferase [Parabacteroides gordonii]|uniref:tRNA1(Val) (adenine(37)-N6)-methyltransferase n=1 Tax=Parabacteroides gordonii TaxID=574930 RepID=UPI0026EF0146|nr:tRNA1(Val) (adenine(37)-N6)-methyltransferase [Parabacteroides gordonii]